MSLRSSMGNTGYRVTEGDPLYALRWWKLPKGKEVLCKVSMSRTTS